MKKNEKYAITIGAVILASLLVLNYAGIISFSAIAYSIQGISNLGCEQGEFISTDEFYGNATVKCTQTQGTLEGLWSLLPEDALRLFGIYTSEPITETSKKLKDYCRLPFDATNTEYIYQYNIMRNKISLSGGYYRCSSDLGASVFNPTAPSIVQQYGQFLGRTPINCNPSCAQYQNPTVTGCDYVYRKTVGQIYYLDPTPIPDYEQQINMSLGDTTYSVIVSQQNKTAYNDLFRVILSEGSLRGSQECPSGVNVVAYIKNVFEPTPIEYHSRSWAETLINNQRAMGTNLNAIISNANTHNSNLDSFLSSQPSLGQYCKKATYEGSEIQTAYLACEPVGSVTVPVWDIFINAKKVGYRVPSGIPVILSTSVVKVESAVRSEVKVTVRNDGDSDNIEATIFCPDDPINAERDFSPFSSSEYIQSGETKDILISYQGAGFIGDCEITARSLNSPQNADETIQKLFLYPFCPREAPSPYHETVFTEYGCAFICPNYHTGNDGADVLSANCRAIEDYDRCNYDIYEEETRCSTKNSYTGIHCTGIGTWMTTNKYFDAVNSGSISPFIPEKREHYYFIVEVEGQPVCDYINEYGFSNGAELSSLDFDYAAGFPEASEQYIAVSTELQAGEPYVPEIPASEEQISIFDQIDQMFRGFGAMEWLAFMGVVIALIFGFANIILNIGKKR